MSDYPQHIIDLFWSKVDKETDQDGHWLWTGALDWDGYGIFSIPTGKPKPRQRHVRAHRFSYEIIFGAIPHGLWVLHQPPCTERRCVKHLYAGNARQNYRDSINVGTRGEYGDNHNRTILTEALVLQIRHDYSSGQHTCVSLDLKYNINRFTVWDIVNRRTWTYLP